MTPVASSASPDERSELRSTSSSSDFTPHPSQSLPLSPERQALVDDIIALYSCKPTIERVKRYTPDAVYDDQFGYADDRFKIAGQWFALPKLFKESENMGYEITRNEADLIQFKNKQKWTLRLLMKSIIMQTQVSLSLDPATVDKNFIQVKIHEDQSDEKGNNHEGLGFSLKKWQADHVAEYIDSNEVNHFKDDKSAEKPLKKYITENLSPACI